jgi:pyruvate-formate lyase-activating enzyme
MHLVDILALRPKPAAGLFLCLTRRCPLSCAHCSTNSMLGSEEIDAEDIVHFVATLTPETRPELVYLTGGEALLRPHLVMKIADMCHAIGTRVVLLSGMFFARQDKIPPLIERAIGHVDHFSASLDIFHEQQVSRAAVLRILLTLVERGQDVSLQVAGLSQDDPYLHEMNDTIRKYFAERVPALFTYVAPLGRGKQLVTLQRHRPRKSMQRGVLSPSLQISPTPCSVASWPVVTFNGTIVGCCNQSIVDGSTSVHLQFGHITTDDWPTVRQNYLTSLLMRAIRIFGPEYTNTHYGSGKVACDGYCETCFRLSEDPKILESLQSGLEHPGISFLEEQLAHSPLDYFIQRHAVPAYAELVKLGYHPSA